MTLELLGLFVAGLVLLTGGAEFLVRGSVRIARGLGISSLVVGLTVVAFGTSSAELTVTLMAALSGRSGVAFGNVVGSNICNVLLVLGSAAVVTPLVVSVKLVKVDGPIMLGLALLMSALAMDGMVSRVDGGILALCLVGYLIFCVREARRIPAASEASAPSEPSEAPSKSGLVKSLGLVVAGLLMLGLGSKWLVDSATVVARSLGVSDLIIGLTVVSIGTSLPEIATSLAAAFQGERDMAVGNVVGSNIFNIVGVLGISSLIAPVPVDSAALHFDIPVMLATCAVCLPMFYSGYRVDRLEGGILLLYYLAYVGFLLLDAQRHDALPMFSWVMLVFVLPLTLLMVLGMTIRALLRPQHPNGAD